MCPLVHSGNSKPTLSKATGFAGCWSYLGCPWPCCDLWEGAELSIPNLGTAAVPKMRGTCRSCALDGNDSPAGVWVSQQLPVQTELMEGSRAGAEC